MAASRPFLFENRDFDRIAEAAVPPKERPQFSQSELNGAVLGAQQRGFEEGLATATQSLEAQITRLLETAAIKMNEFHAAETERTAASQNMAIEVAVGLMRKLMPELANQQSLEGISRIIKQVMMERFEEPRLIIRVHDSVLNALSARLESLAAQNGFRGQYALMADHALAVTDCRIEWSNGGVERSVIRLWDNLQITLAQIQAAVTQSGASAVANTSTEIPAMENLSHESSPPSNESDAT